MDGEGDNDLKVEREKAFYFLSRVSICRASLNEPKRAFGKNERFELREDSTQTANFQPVGDWIAVQVKFSHAFMGVCGLTVSIAAQRALKRAIKAPEVILRVVN